MWSWRAADMLGRSLILISIFVQLVLIPVDEQMLRDDFEFNVLENQLILAQMASNLSADQPNQDQISQSYLRIVGANEFMDRYDGSNFQFWIPFTRWIFVGAFLIGSILTLYGRAGELREGRVS